MNLRSRCPVTGSAQPSMLVGTKSLKPAFESLSTLARATADRSPHFPKSFFSVCLDNRDVQAAFRHASFAGRISSRNTFEYMAHCLNDKRNPLVVAHVDDQNDTEPVNASVITVVRILVDTTTSPPELKRLVQIGTNRKSISDFMKRATAFGPEIDRLKMFRDSLPTCHQEFSPSSFFRDTIGHTGLVEGTCFITPANADRCIMESATAFAIQHFCTNGNPQYRMEVYEVAMSSVWFSEPYKFFWCVEE